MKKSKLLSIYLSINTFLLLVSGSIALPILFRPFYYWQIKPLNISRYYGYSYEVIKQAYDEMMDFCIGLSSTFSTGQLAFSESGMQHFVDCKALFILDFAVLAFSILTFVIYHFIKKKVSADKVNKHSYLYNGAFSTITIFTAIALLAMPDFDYAFMMFHKLFFPGKTNWVFDPRYDEIINILPEEFFMNCAILIVGVLITSCIIILIKEKKKELTNE